MNRNVYVPPKFEPLPLTQIMPIFRRYLLENIPPLMKFGSHVFGLVFSTSIYHPYRNDKI